MYFSTKGFLSDNFKSLSLMNHFLFLEEKQKIRRHAHYVTTFVVEIWL